MSLGDLSKSKDASAQFFRVEDPFGLLRDFLVPQVVVETGLSAIDSVKPLLFAELLNNIFLDEFSDLIVVIDLVDSAKVGSQVEDLFGDKGAELLKDGN